MTGRARTQRLERFAAPIEIKSLDASKGEFEGYLAVFNNTDFNGDVCEPGCFKKTLTEAYEVKKRTNAKFLFPLLWMHDEENPVGGFYDMSEDSHGLYVKGQCDLDTEQGRRTFSGMQKGYMAQLSIGYISVKASRDAKGIRHLLETRLLEGSAITTGYAANPAALVLATKRRMLAVKGASGKSSWPLGERDTAWDGTDAHSKIVAWATGSDDKLDESKMKSVHFWVDDSAPDKIDSYKLPFCTIVDGDPVAMPRGIMACAGAMQGSRGTGVAIPSGDTSAVQAKIAAYYKRMAKTFDDDSLVAPWDEKKIALRRAIEEKQLGGVQTITYCLSNISYMVENIDMMLEMLGDVCGLNLDPDEALEPDDDDVTAQLIATPIPGAVIQPAVSVLLDNLDGFKDALLTVGTTFQDLDTAMDQALDKLGMESDDYGVMSYKPMLSVKVAKQLSKANRDTIQKVIDGLSGHSATLTKMLDLNDADTSTASRHDAPRKSELRATTSDDNGAEPESEDDSTLAQGLEELLFASQLTATRLKVS